MCSSCCECSHSSRPRVSPSLLNVFGPFMLPFSILCFQSYVQIKELHLDSQPWRLQPPPPSLAPTRTSPKLTIPPLPLSLSPMRPRLPALAASSFSHTSTLAMQNSTSCLPIDSLRLWLFLSPAWPANLRRIALLLLLHLCLWSRRCLLLLQ